MITEKIKNLLASQPPVKASPEITDEIKTRYNNHRPLGPQPFACYAPFKNMYFGHHGRVYACCFNRHHVLGNYPAQTIMQIWQGEKANRLRQYLKEYNFSLGCDNCLQQLVAGNFDGTKAKQYDAHRVNKNEFPSVLEFELDNTCNLECIMCSGDFSSLIRTKREHRPELPKTYDDAFINQLDDFIPHLEEVKFYGGEPFLIPAYYKIWDKIIALNPAVRISVQTNGTTVNTRVKEILQKTNFYINLSLDSLDKERYEYIRRNSSFDTVMENLKYFHAYCRERKTTFGISACLMQNNWFEAPGFIRFCNQLEVTIYFHTVHGPDFVSLMQFSKPQLEEVYNTLAAQLDTLPENTAIQKKNKRHYHDFMLQVLEWSKKHDANPETEDIHTVEQLGDFLQRKTMERTDIDEEKRKISAAKIAGNVQMLSQILPPGTDISGLIKHVNIKDEVILINYLEAAENGIATDAITHLKWQAGELIKGKK